MKFIGKKYYSVLHIVLLEGAYIIVITNVMNKLNNNNK
jgi:hypothetical protein